MGNDVLAKDARAPGTSVAPRRSGDRRLAGRPAEDRGPGRSSVRAIGPEHQRESAAEREHVLSRERLWRHLVDRHPPDGAEPHREEPEGSNRRTLEQLHGDLLPGTWSMRTRASDRRSVGAKAAEPVGRREPDPRQTRRGPACSEVAATLAGPGGADPRRRVRRRRRGVRASAVRRRYGRARSTWRRQSPTRRHEDDGNRGALPRPRASSSGRHSQRRDGFLRTYTQAQERPIEGSGDARVLRPAERRDRVQPEQDRARDDAGDRSPARAAARPAPGTLPGR